jgi:hypothetical protein
VAPFSMTLTPAWVMASFEPKIVSLTPTTVVLA